MIELFAKTITRKCLMCYNGTSDCPMCKGSGITYHIVMEGNKLCDKCFGGTLPKKLEKNNNGELLPLDLTIKDCTECDGFGNKPIDLGEFGLFSSDSDIHFKF